ncbi:MAG: hypothetical protein ACR2RA_08080 [Geminicoccaceae bacterium]
MQPMCTDKMKIARELLDFGVLGEGVENLVRLRHCACRAGCNRWHLCFRMVEGQWPSSKPTRQFVDSQA